MRSCSTEDRFKEACLCHRSTSPPACKGRRLCGAIRQPIALGAQPPPDRNGPRPIAHSSVPCPRPKRPALVRTHSTAPRTVTSEATVRATSRCRGRSTSERVAQAEVRHMPTFSVFSEPCSAAASATLIHVRGGWAHTKHELVDIGWVHAPLPERSTRVGQAAGVCSMQHERDALEAGHVGARHGQRKLTEKTGRRCSSRWCRSSRWRHERCRSCSGRASRWWAFGSGSRNRRIPPTCLRGH